LILPACGISAAQLWKVFSEHDALVMPSTRLEAFGLVAVEAQACGLPVLHTRVPGLAEVLGDSGLAVDFATDPGAATAVVTGLRDDPGALADLRSSGQRNAACFPLSRTASELRALSAEVAI
jgi:glycosyltransferase involved in cell wall biosynthesis